MRAAAPRVAYLALEGLTRPVALCGCEELLPLFSQVLGTWPTAVSRATPSAAPVISIERRGERFVLNSPWVGPELADDSGPGTVCSTLVDLATEFSRDNPDLVGLHCGAVRLGGRLVLLPAVTRSGKSTLVARLAAGGHKVWADDLLAIDPEACIGRAFGIMPRLRRPVPRAAGRFLNGFVRARTGISDRRQVYLALGADELAVYGEVCPLGAVVLLDRQASGPAALEPIGRGATVERLLSQTLIQTGSANALFERLAALAEMLPAFRLRYADLDEAAEILSATDWQWPARLPAIAARPAEESAALVEPAIAKGQFVRDRAAALREVDGERFLVSSRSEGVFGLDPVAAGIWDLLAEPISEAEIADALVCAFPATDPAEITRDVGALLRRLVEDELVVEG